MVTGVQKEVIDAIQIRMTELGYATRTKEDGDLTLLQIALEAVGHEDNGNALLEFCFLPIPEDDQLPADLHLFQIYTTLVPKVPAKNKNKVLQTINEVNMESVIGAYGIYEEQMQIYHRHVMVLRGNDHERLMENITPSLNWILYAIEEDYLTLTALCS